MQNQYTFNSFKSNGVLSNIRLFFRNHFFEVVAVLTFFLLITAQTLWSAIHGDGAVYAWVTKEMALNGFFSGKLPNWDQTQVFAEHPYFFFYFASFFVKVFGVSDLALKLPNYLVAAVSLFALFKAARLKWGAEQGSSIGLIAGYALLLNGTYMMQISQPSLDPMAQLLGLIAVMVLAFTDRAFLSGLVLGAAFLTKGLELLPNLAALVLVTAFLKRSSYREVMKSVLVLGAGIILPVLGWLLLDQLIWNGEWIKTYWFRQFTMRFLNPVNVKKAFDLSYLLTATRVYFVEIFILAVWLLSTDAWKEKRRDPLFLYFVLYCVFNISAFLIIKKDSSQHATGLLVAGSLFVGQAIYDIWKKMGARRLWAVPVSLLVIAFTYWSWFFVNADHNPDMWTVVKNESQILSGNSKLPIVIRNADGEGYGLFHTAQWYSKSDRVYFQSDADRLLVGQEVVCLIEKSDGQLTAARVIYQKNIF